MLDGLWAGYGGGRALMQVLRIGELGIRGGKRGMSQQRAG